MLDENLPTFFIKPSSDSDLQSTIYLGQGGHELHPEYTLRRPDPNNPASKNCYAVALSDSYNPDVLYAEVLVKPEWTLPTLSQAEIRANNGITPPPVPIVPNTFVIQLYNPDQQVIVRQIAGSWNSSAFWEFEMPQQTFRIPSTSSLDREQSNPALSVATPKVTFKWKRDGKLNKDITCYLAGKSTEGKKSKEPDITIAMFKHGKELTVYEPNMHRVEVEDTKGLEVVILLGATVIKDIFFNPSREMFNISSPSMAGVRKNSNPLVGTKKTPTPPLISGGLGVPPPPTTKPPSHGPPQHNYAPPGPSQHSYAHPGPPAVDPMKQWEIEAESARLRAQADAEEREREKRDRQEQKRIKRMLEQEEKERQRREAEVAKETERLRKQYGIQPVPDNFKPAEPRVHFTPPLPMRPTPHSAPPMPPRPQQMPHAYSAPHSRPPPIQRPSSASAAPNGPFNCSTLNSWWGGPNASAPAPAQPPRDRHRRGTSGSSPYLQLPGEGSASASVSRLLGIGVEGDGGRRKVAKKRSVYF